MAVFSDLYDLIRSNIRGVEEPTIDMYTRLVTRDFLKATTLWRETLTVQVMPGITEYNISARSGGLVAGILEVLNPPQSLRVKNVDESRRMDPILLEPQRPDGWWSLYPGVISFNRVPDANYTFLVKTYKQLTQDPTDVYIPDEVFDNYGDDLAEGVKARVLAMPSKPWTDTNMATVANTLYIKSRSAIRAKIRNGGAAGHSRVVAPLFAGR